MSGESGYMPRNISRLPASPQIDAHARTRHTVISEDTYLCETV